MKALAGLLLLSSFSVFAVDIEKTVEILKKDKPCYDGGERTKISLKTNRKERKGHHYFGSTTAGDIAVLEDSNKVTLYVCKRKEPITSGKVSNSIDVTVPEFNNCKVQQIIQMNVVLNEKMPLYFRWIQAGEPRTSLCTGSKFKPKAIEKAEDCEEDGSSLLDISKIMNSVE